LPICLFAYLPIRLKGECNQPTFDGKKVHIILEIKEGLDAIIEAGLTAPTIDYAMDGMQLPQVAASGAFMYLATAKESMSIGYLSLTHANTNLIETYGTPE
jgi:butyryl-CoA dehydrogenase